VSETGRRVQWLEPFVVLKDCVNSLIYPEHGTAGSRPENMEMIPKRQGVAIRYVENLTGGSETIRCVCIEG
jgi:hypothetical protein